MLRSTAVLFITLNIIGCTDEPVTEGTSAAPNQAAASTSSPKVVPMSDKVVRSDDEWKALLSAEQYHVLREKGTEQPFVNKYDDEFSPGTYGCAACGQELFSSEAKFNSGCGWPAFYTARAGDRVKLTPDHSYGMVRVEVTCARCDSHLGHIFDDAPHTPTGQRYCINSVALQFIPDEGGDAPP
jgi:peptide-methionine (R)-S-oxide reductase